MKNLFKGIGFSLLLGLFPVLAGTIITINNVTDESSIYLIQELMFAIASVLGIIIYRILFKNTNFNKVLERRTFDFKKVLYLIPILVIEVLQLVQGINTEKLKFFFPILLLVIFVGIAEEVFFRGIILKILHERGKNFAVIGSAILFSLLHLLNLLGGQSLVYTLIQLVFALVWGLVTAEFVYTTGTIFPLIIWHSLHDLIGLMSGKDITQASIIIGFIQTAIIFVYYLYLKKENDLNKYY